MQTTHVDVFNADGLGSTTELVEDDGDVANAYRYDVWGALRSSSGSVANQFDFTGEQADHNANRGLVYLRARHYDPALGRFLGRDPLPMAHRYAYAINSPARYTDPTGMCVLGAPCFDDAVECVSNGFDCVRDGGKTAVRRTKAGAKSFGSWAYRQLVKICPSKESGYVDLNVTAGVGMVGTFGVQCTKEQGLHGYYGAGGGGGFSISLTQAPQGQAISTGDFCGIQGTWAPPALRGGGGTVNIGVGAIQEVLEGDAPAPFLEVGGSHGAIGLSASAICGRVF